MRALLRAARELPPSAGRAAAARSSGSNPSRHGWDGWLHDRAGDAGAAIRDRDLRTTILESAQAACSSRELGVTDVDRRAGSRARSIPTTGASCPRTRDRPPLHAADDAATTSASGTRERVLDVAQRYPGSAEDRAERARDPRAVRRRTRAIGVEYQNGERLYRAHRAAERGAPARREQVVRRARSDPGRRRVQHAAAADALGIGPRAELEKHGIPVRVDLPGVGQNLQDRYEVAVVNRMNFEAWEVLEGATFTQRRSRSIGSGRRTRDGVYTTNGAILSVVARSSPAAPVPDLFCYACSADFAGYFPGYSKRLPPGTSTTSRGSCSRRTRTTPPATVTLRSRRSARAAGINFHYFDEGTDGERRGPAAPSSPASSSCAGSPTS